MRQSEPNANLQHLLRTPLPREMALACENAGRAKSDRDAISLLVLGVLAGAFIAFGAIFMTVIVTGSSEMPWGMGRLLGGLVFSLGLILVIIGGAELFTGDCLMIIAFASRRIELTALLRAWGLVYAGNIIGAVTTAILVFLSGHHLLGNGAVARTALTIAAAKAQIPSLELFFLAVLCNVLVCLAVWMSLGARTLTDKVAVIVPPIAAFVAAGFEHSIANLYFLPYGLFLSNWVPPEVLALPAPVASTVSDLTVFNSAHNILIATAGNLVGGSLLVGMVYWFLYLRHPSETLKKMKE